MNSSPRRVRRAPNVVAFLLTGALIGLLAGLAIAVLGGDSPGYGTVQVLGLFGVTGAGAGALLAGVVAVLLEQRSLR